MTTDDLAEKVAAVLHHEGWPADDGWALTPDTCETCARSLRQAAALVPLIREREAAAWERALRLPRQVEADMSDQAAKAWRSADARRGLADHGALLVHADALTRWSERFRMAFDGEDYRDASANPYAGSEGER